MVLSCRDVFDPVPSALPSAFAITLEIWTVLDVTIRITWSWRNLESPTIPAVSKMIQPILTSTVGQIVQFATLWQAHAWNALQVFNLHMIQPYSLLRASIFADFHVVKGAWTVMKQRGHALIVTTQGTLPSTFEIKILKPTGVRISLTCVTQPVSTVTNVVCNSIHPSWQVPAPNASVASM